MLFLSVIVFKTELACRNINHNTANYIFVNWTSFRAMIYFLYYFDVPSIKKTEHIWLYFIDLIKIFLIFGNAINKKLHWSF